MRAWQNVPVLSWLLLRGECAACGAPISARYPLVELATGAGVRRRGLGCSLGSVDAAPSGTAVPRSARRLPLFRGDQHRARRSSTSTRAGCRTRSCCRLRRRAPCSSPPRASSARRGRRSCGRAIGGGGALRVLLRAARRSARTAWAGATSSSRASSALSLGWLGWGALVVGAFAAFLLGGVFGVALLLARRADAARAPSRSARGCSRARGSASSRARTSPAGIWAVRCELSRRQERRAPWRRHVVGLEITEESVRAAEVTGRRDPTLVAYGAGAAARRAPRGTPRCWTRMPSLLALRQLWSRAGSRGTHVVARRSAAAASSCASTRRTPCGPTCCARRCPSRCRTCCPFPPSRPCSTSIPSPRRTGRSRAARRRRRRDASRRSSARSRRRS